MARAAIATGILARDIRESLNEGATMDQGFPLVVVLAVTSPVLVWVEVTITVLLLPSTTTSRLLPIADEEPATPPAPEKASPAPLALAWAKMLSELFWIRPLMTVRLPL